MIINKSQLIRYILDNQNMFREKYRINRFGLFGSFARSEERANSDIDLLVDFYDGTDNLFDLKNQLRQHFKQKFNRDVDICREKFIKPIFKEEIHKDSIYVY